MSTSSEYSPEFLLFLDIDGVLHLDDGRGGVLWPDCITRINTIAEECNASIVISSSWREFHDWREFNRYFLGRVIGATPILDLRRPCIRYWEVVAWLQEHECEKVPWLAIDDLHGLYPPQAPVYIVDGEQAITDTDVENIKLLITSGDLRDRTNRQDFLETPKQQEASRWWRRLFGRA